MNILATKTITRFGLVLALSLLPVGGGTTYGVARPQTSETILIEGESGNGAGILMQRSQASRLCDVWLRMGEVRQLPFQVSVQGRYRIRVRYSNDHYGLPLDEVAFHLDDQNIGLLTAQDTGDYGHGWNTFLWSPTIAEVELSPGAHTLSVAVVRGDGVELDLIEIELDSAAPLPQVIEGETGEGDGLYRFRSQASQVRTIWLTTGQVRQYTFQVAAQTSYSISLRYSNDHFGFPLDQIEVKLDEQLLGTVTLQDTGDYGHGWNNFSPVLVTTVATLAAGTHTITVKVATGDGFELDMIKLDPQN